MATRRRAPKLPVPSEHESQAALFTRIDMHPVLKHRRIFAVPNGGHRHIAVAKKLKAEGVRAGVPDVFVDEPRGPRIGVPAYHGLRIEMKKPGNKPTREQQAWLMDYQLCGYAIAVCFSADEAWQTICRYMEVTP